MSIATLLDELKKLPGTIVFELRIAGIEVGGEPVVWTSAIRHPYTLTGEKVYPGIVLPSPTETVAESDQKTGLTASGRVTVRLRPQADGVMDGLLMRRGRKGADYVAKLTESLTQDQGAATVKADRAPTTVDGATLPATGYIHIGQEAIEYTARTTVAPYTFTVPADGRGAFDTVIDRHTVHDDRPAPRIYSNVCTWTGRPATLKVSRLRPDGVRAADSFELTAGKLDRAPHYRSREGLFDVVIVPLSVAGQQQIGGEETTTSVQRGLIAIAADDPVRSVALRMRWRRGEVFRESGSSVADGVIDDIVWGPHQEVFDYDVGDRAREGDVYIANTAQTYAVDGAAPYNGNATDGSGTLTLTDDLDIAGLTRVENAECEVQIEVDVAAAGADAAVQWPWALVNAIANNWNPGTTQGAAGQWADVGLDPSVAVLDGRPALTARLNSDTHQGQLDIIVHSGERERLWYLADFRDPDGALRGPQPQPLDGVPVFDQRWWRDRVISTSLAKSDNRTGRVLIPIAGIARGGWQTGMKWVWVQDDRFGTPPFIIRVDFEALDGSPASTSIRIVGKQAASAVFGAGYPGYLLETDADDRWRRHSFADFGGQAPVISQQVRWRYTSPQVALLQVMTSTWGDQKNGVYDVLPRGGRVPIDRIHLRSFLDYANPGAVLDLVEDFDLTETTTINAVVRGLLAMLNAQLELRLDESDGKIKLALGDAGAPIATDAVAEITSDMLDGDGEASTVGGQPRANTPVFELNIGSDQKPQLTVSFPDDALLAEHGGRVLVDKVRMRGLRVPPDPGTVEALLRPLAESRLARLGDESAIVHCIATMPDTLKVHPGSTILLSSRTAHDPRGKRPGLDRTPVKIVAMKRRSKDLRVEMKVWNPGFNGKGYAPALKITGSAAADRVTVAANAYTETTHPITGQAQTDLDFFAVGDVVQVIPRGRREDADVGLTIESINTTTREVVLKDGQNAAALPAVVRAAPFGTIRPAPYGQASDAHKKFAFIADAAAQLPGGVAADEYT